MFKNYLKMAYRSLRKNKLPSVINIAGLSLAIGCCVFAYVYADFYYNRDDFHKNVEKIFLIRNVIGENVGQELWANSPVALGPTLAIDFPQVKRAVRIANARAAVKLDDKVFNERVRFVDAGFFDMFSFPLVSGRKDALQNKNNLILSEDLAIKYFGDLDPVGKSLFLTFDENHSASFLIGGVAKKLPKKASFGFDILINYEKQRDLGEADPNSWEQMTGATFIQVEYADQIGEIAAGMHRYIALQNAANPERPISAFRFEPLTTMATNDYQDRGGIVSVTLYPGQMLNLVFLVIFFLLLAIFNYINIAIVSATRRFKEIGVRKVVGSKRSQLIKQFLCENVLVCFLALLIGIMLADQIITPGFNNLWGASDWLEVDYVGSVQLWVFFAVLLLLTGIGAGAYPAFLISSFQPVNIFKRKQKISGKNRLTKVLLTFQFVLSFMILTNSVVFIQNSRYQRQHDWGYNQEHLLVLPVENASQYTILKNEIDRHPGVLHTCGATEHIGRSRVGVVVEIAGKKVEVVQFSVGFNYFETMGLRLKTGRVFDENLGTDRQESIMVNETFVNLQGWEGAIGKLVAHNNRRYKIIGVFEDFRSPRHFMSRIEPMMLRVAPEENLTCLIAKVAAGTGIQTAGFVREAWRNVMPERPYSGYFQDEIFNSIFQVMDGITNGSLFIGVIALVMTCMGIFGLVSLNIAKRTKELSLRKVLGANVVQVMRLINKGFIDVLVIATVIALPANYFIIKAILGMFTYHVTLSWLPFAIAFSLILLTAIATISSRVYKAATVNPVDALRSE